MMFYVLRAFLVSFCRSVPFFYITVVSNIQATDLLLLETLVRIMSFKMCVSDIVIHISLISWLNFQLWRNSVLLETLVGKMLTGCLARHQPEMPQSVQGGFVKFVVGAMDPVPNTKPTIAGVELEVMEVVEFRGEVKREMVTAVVIHHLKLNHAEPEPGNWKGSAHEENPRAHRELACKQVLQRMRVKSCNGKRSRPLMVDLVDMFVDESVMQETMSVVKPGVMREDADQHVSECRLQGGEGGEGVKGGRPRRPQGEGGHPSWDAQNYLVDKHMLRHLPHFGR